MKNLFFIILLCIDCLAVFAQKTIAKYDYVDETGKLTINKVTLIKRNALYTFCFATDVVQTFRDTIIDGQKISVSKLNEQDNPCGFHYGDYSYTKRGSFIFLKIYDSLSKKLMNHKQYSLIKGDSTSYASIFAGPHFKYPLQEGYATFLTDTTIKSSGGATYSCYVFEETTGRAFDRQYPVSRKMFWIKNLFFLSSMNIINHTHIQFRTTF